MSAYIVSPKADEDIFDVWRYLYGRAGVEVANRIEAELYGMFEKSLKIPVWGTSVRISPRTRSSFSASIPT
jgi:plasmid stabilization system protein ParE